MSKGGASQVTGFRYSMSILFGLGIGPIDKLAQIKANDLEIWPQGGEPGATPGPILDNQGFTIAASKIFGGDDKEGGIAGQAIIQMGADAQIADATIKGAIGGNVSDLRGWCTLFYDGLICSNNPYPKPWKFCVERALKGWYLDQCWYPIEAWIVNGMNPAHILVECLTNPVWGRGYSLSQLDEDSFRSAANTLCDERFGLNFMWSRSVSLTEFMNIVVNHIGAALYTDRITGLVALKLLRDDYDPTLLPVFGYDSGLLEITDDATTAPDSSHNELVVTYIDPIDGEKRQVRIQNIAGIQASNNIASTSVDYLGIPSAELAGRVGQRDMSIQAAGIRKFNLKLDRRGRKLQPGGVFRITAPDRSIADMVLRVGSIEQGNIKDQTLTVKALQDVFALEVASYVVVQPSTWVPPDNNPVPPTLRRMEEITWRDTVRALSGDATALAGVDLDESMPVIVGQKPVPASTNFILQSRTDPFTPWVDKGAFPWTPTATLTAGIGYYDAFTIAISNGDNIRSVRMNGIIWLGFEQVQITAMDLSASPPTIDIRRGCVDTIPARHGPGTRIWFPEDTLAGDGTQYIVGDTVYYGMETQTSTGLSAPSDDNITLAGRQARPYPMGALTIGGVPFGSALIQPASGDLVFDGTERNRLTQADHIVAHEDADVAQEAGTTYNYRFYDGTSTTPLRSVTGLTDPSFTYTAAMYTADGTVPLLRVEAESERDSLVSYQHYDFIINRSGVAPGHGFDHGNNHGAP